MKLKKVLSLALCGVMLSTTAVSIVPTIFAKESGTETYNTSSGYGTKIENGSFEQPPIDRIYSQLNQKQVVVASISGIFFIMAVKVMIQWHLLSDQSKSMILRKLPKTAKTNL